MADQLRYPFDRVPEPAETIEVAPGVLWLRMPLKLTGLSHINLWLLDDGDGWTIVDTGMNTDEIRAHWDEIFARDLAGRPVTRVICTQFHPDHMGLAGWLTTRWQAPLWATRREWLFGRMLYLDAADEPPAFYLDHFRQLGFKADALDRLRDAGYNHYRNSVWEIPGAHRRIVDGEVIEIGGRAWQVIVGYGHAPEHACLYCDELKVMISGDQVLPKITPHIGVYPSEPDANPLEEYIDSLANYRHLPADTLVLPAHNEPFHGLQARLDYLQSHHDERLAALEAALTEPTRVMSTLKILFRRELRSFEAFLGIGESLAHLHCLIGRGRVVRSTDADGVFVYRRTQEAADAA